ncbi:unnamed protein product [Chrysoparadoxa australica]
MLSLTCFPATSGSKTNSIYQMVEATPKVNESINDGNNFVVTSQHVVLCKGKHIQLYGFKGVEARGWELESKVTCIKVDGGKPGCEGLLVGLANGSVLQVFVDNAFPVLLVKGQSAIRCCDLSMLRKKVAIVDDTNRVSVYSMQTKEVLFQEAGASQVAFNSEVEDMLCYCGGGYLFLKTGDFPIHQHTLLGEMVGFRGSRVYSLHGGVVTAQDIPQNFVPAFRYIEAGDYSKAYATACLGVTRSNWRLLAMCALQAANFSIAKQALIRVKDMRFVALLEGIEQRLRSIRRDPVAQNKAEQEALALVLAHQGMYQEAAKVFARNGMVQKAIDMFVDLRQWEEAKVFAATCESVDTKDLVRRQAEWAEEVNDWRNASEMYMKAGEPLKAVEIVTSNLKHGWVECLVEIVRSVPKSETKVLQHCGHVFVEQGESDEAREVFLKLEDYNSLMDLHIRDQVIND